MGAEPQANAPRLFNTLRKPIIVNIRYISMRSHLVHNKRDENNTGTNNDSNKADIIASHKKNLHNMTVRSVSVLTCIGGGKSAAATTDTAQATSLEEHPYSTTRPFPKGWVSSSSGAGNRKGSEEHAPPSVMACWIGQRALYVSLFRKRCDQHSIMLHGTVL